MSTAVDAARRVANRLVGSCSNLETTEEYENHCDDQAFLEEIDRVAYCCTSCEWWFAKTDRYHDTVTGWCCDECHREENEILNN